MARSILNSSRSTLKEIANKTAVGDTMMLDSASLVEHEDNEWLFGMEGIDRLAEGIKKVGFKGAIEVWDKKDGTYEIYSGARRNRANSLLGKTTIPAFVYPYPATETERRRQLLGANIYGRNAVKSDDAIHTARQISYLRDTIKMERENGTYDGEKTREEMAKEFGTSPSSIYKYESLLKLNDEAQKAVMNGIIQIGQGSSMSVLSDYNQNVVLDALDIMNESNIAGTRDDIQKIIDYVKLHENEQLIAKDVIEAVCNQTNANKKNVPAASQDIDSQGTASEGQKEVIRKAYTPKVTIKKFGQCYGKMEEFFQAEKHYKEEDCEDVLDKLRQLKNMIDAEISKIEGPEEEY